MTYRRLGDSGLMVSAVGIGCNNFGRKLDLDGTRAVVDAALDVGINLFDTADIYGEPAAAPRRCSARRSRAAATTSCWPPSSAWTWHGRQRRRPRRPRVARATSRRAVEASLRRLRHRPHRPLPAARARPGHADRGDAVGAERPGPRGQGALPGLLQLRRLAGRRRRLDRPHRAASSASSARRTTTPCSSGASRRRWCRPASSSGSACCRTSRSPTACSPASTGAARPPPAGSRLAGGGRYAARLAAAPWDTIEALETYAAERGLSLLDVAIGGLAAQPAVASVIAGATPAEQVRANAAAGSWQPSADDLAALRAIL